MGKLTMFPIGCEWYGTSSQWLSLVKKTYIDTKKRGRKRGLKTDE